MSILTRANIKQHCRTCLKKSKTEISNLETNINPTEEAYECKDFWISIANNEEMQNLITSFINERWPTESKQDEYPQFLCFYCYKKLQNFDLFRKLIRRSARKLREVLDQGVNKVEIDEDEGEEKQKIQIAIGSKPKTKDIFHLLLKDTLMETESVLLDQENDGTKVSEILLDPDPFDTTICAKPKNSLSEPSSPSSALSEESNKQQWLLCSQAESEDDIHKRDESMESVNVECNTLKEKRSKGKTESGSPTANSRRNLSAQCAANQVEKGIKTENGTTRRTQGRLYEEKIDRKTKRRNKGTKNNFKCEQCGHSFAHKITLDAHIRKVHEGSKRPFQCDRCEKSYTFIGGLYTHIKEIHEAEARSYACSYTGCDRIYTSFIAMQKHKRLKHSDTPCLKKYVCEQCGATFNQSGNLKYHRRSKHPTEAEQAEQEHLKERFECDVCKKLFHSRYTLKYHTLQLHSNEMKYECNVCGRRMAKKFMLVQHMLVHSTDKMPCEHCGRQFIRKFELEAHVRAVHMKLKPFECQYCSECFASRKTLRHHEYIHTGEKPYVCDICGQAYRQQTCLKNHRKSHEKLNVNMLASNINRTVLNAFSTTSQYSKMVPLTN